MANSFVHLQVHSEHAIIDGLIRIPQLLKKTADLQMPAVAMTDLSNLFGMVKFYQASLAAGIKPIIGADLWIENPQRPQEPFRATLLCQNEMGYKNLIQLISKSYLDNQIDEKPIVKRCWLEDFNAGLIVLSGATQGDIGQALLKNKSSLAKEFLTFWINHFENRFYLELQRTGHTQEENYIQEALTLADQFQLPVVATNAVRFIDKQDFEAHEARTCIHAGWILADEHRPRHYTEQQYFASSETMEKLFSDIPEAITNTIEIAKRCNVVLNLGKNYLPNFSVPEGSTVEHYLEQSSKKGLHERLSIIFKGHPQTLNEKKSIYEDRLRDELTVINKMGFAGYFLIVSDFIQWAKENGIPVGPGRGSGAGSLVAYALKITDIDPLQYNLLFERFLNPERVSMPDFDIDFCMDGRDRVIDYVAEKYGRRSVSQIITYGTMAARAVVRDVGRVLGHGYGFVDAIAKLIPFELGITLTDALEKEESLQERYDKEPEIKHLIDLAKKLEGLIRNVGKHAGGVVISPSLLTDFAPLYCEPNGENLVTQFDKYDVETVGLVKFDFLGLRTLTIINSAVNTINDKLQNKNEDMLDISLIPLDDKATFQTLKCCQTVAVFQLESRGMRDLIKRLQPDCFEDIVALVALFRPGPLQSGMVDDFINRKHGRAEVRYPHPKLAPVLGTTYGVILYQEQVMQIAQVLAGYSFGSADLLRRAMGKKKPKEMAKQRKIFMKGAIKQGVDERTAEYIFDLMEKFAGYGFNKSHSAAYALIAYQTAWLKTHFTAEFMSAVLSSDMDNTDKVMRFVEECHELSLPILPPDINQSEYQFIVKDEKILYGLGAIKGVGSAAIENILSCRKQDGPFKDLFDFCSRIDLRKINKRVLEALIKSGTLDALAPHRAAMWHKFNELVQAAEQHRGNALCGQMDLFADFEEETAAEYQPNYDNIKPWTQDQILTGEQETLGYYFSGHPIDRYEQELNHIVTDRIANLELNQNKSVIIAGLVIGLRTMQTKRGDRMSFVTLEDRGSRIEVAVFSDSYYHYRQLLQKYRLLVIEGELSVDSYTDGFRLSANKILTIDQAREIYAKYLLLNISEKDLNKTLIQQLKNTFSLHANGNCPICIGYTKNNAKVLLPLDTDWRIKPTDDLLEQLKENFPGIETQMYY